MNAPARIRATCSLRVIRGKSGFLGFKLPIITRAGLAEKATPPQTSVRGGVEEKLGVGVRHALFPNWLDIRRSAKAGCQLPDAVLHGKRSSRSRSRTVPTLAGAGLLSEASLPGSIATRRWRLAGQGADTPARMSHPACRRRLPRGRPFLVGKRWPRATGLTSYLSDCIRLAAGRRRL